MENSRHRERKPPPAAGRSRELGFIYCDPRGLQPRSTNPRTHSKRQIRQIAASIKEFGFNSPVLVDGAGGIIAGHGRVEAAKLLGLREIPTVRVDHLNPHQIRAYVIADNRLAEIAGWDRELLALELQGLAIEPDFDVTLTGFDTAEIDLLIRDLAPEMPDKADQVPEIDRSAPAVSRKGDLWRIGEHALLCGDALDRDSYGRLLGHKKAQIVFTDPPYNVAIDGHVSGLGKTRHREFAMASGEMSRREFTDFLETAFGHLVDFSADGSIHFACMDWRHMREVLDAADATYRQLKGLCVWTKTNGGMGSLYRSQHELVFVFKKGLAPHINNIELGRFGRNRTNVWAYAGMNAFGTERERDLAMHPTVKPLALVADAILDCSKRSGIVLDPFAGSGTTLIAAEKTGRRGYGIELDPHYVDTIIRRFDDLYGLKAVHDGSGLDFEAIATKRSSERGDSDGKKSGTRSAEKRQARGCKNRSRKPAKAHTVSQGRDR